MPASKQYVALYARVSSPKRNGRSRQKTDSQKLALKRYASSHGLKGAKYHEDHATGRTISRDSLDSILGDVRAGKVSDLVVWKLDRLSRSLTEMIQTFELLLSHGCTLHVTSQSLVLDAQSPFTSFLVGLFGLLGRLESDLTSERIRAGLAVAREQGTRLGAKPKDKVRAKIERWTAAGIPVAEQAKRLGVSRQSIYRMRGRMLAGKDE